MCGIPHYVDFTSLELECPDSRCGKFMVGPGHRLQRKMPNCTNHKFPVDGGLDVPSEVKSTVAPPPTTKIFIYTTVQYPVLIVSCTIFLGLQYQDYNCNKTQSLRCHSQPPILLEGMRFTTVGVKLKFPFSIVLLLVSVPYTAFSAKRCQCNTD